MSNDKIFDINQAFTNILQTVDVDNNNLYNEIEKYLKPLRTPNNTLIIENNFQTGGGVDFNKFLEELNIKKNNGETHQFFKDGESFKLALLSVDYIDTFFNNLDYIKDKIPKNGHMFNWENGNLRLYKYDEKNKLILLNENCGFNNCGFKNCDKLVECFGDVVNVGKCKEFINNNNFDKKNLPTNNEERYIMCYKILRGLGFEEVFNNKTYYFTNDKNKDIYDQLSRYSLTHNLDEDNLDYLMAEANKGLLEVFNKEKVSNKQDFVNNTAITITPDKGNTRNPENVGVVQRPFKKNNLKLDTTLPYNSQKNQTLFYGGVKEDLLKKHFYKLMDIIKNNEIHIEEKTALFLKDYEELLILAVQKDYEVDDVNKLMEYYQQLRTYTTEAMLDKKLIKSLKELKDIQDRNDYNENEFNEVGNYEVSKEKYILEKQDMFKEILSRLYKYLNNKFPDLTHIFKPAQILFENDFDIDIDNFIKKESTTIYENKNIPRKNYYTTNNRQNFS